MKRREKITAAELEAAAARLEEGCKVRAALLAEIERRARRRPVRWDRRPEVRA